MSALILRGGRAWDGLAAATVEANVVIDEGKVVAIGADAGAAETIDISGCTVIPGLVEAHAHLCFNARSDWRQVYDSDTPGRMLLRMAANGRRMLEAGITTVRDLGAPTDLAIEVRRAFADGLAAGPDLLVAGAPITTTGGHCYFMGGEADGELEIRKAVRERVKAGCDWIKVMAGGGNMTAGTNLFAPQYSVDELRACIEEAHRLRRKVTAHCHGVEPIRTAVEAGVDMLEHCSFQAPRGYEYDPALAQQIVAKGIVVSPTTSIGYHTWADDGRKQQRKEIMRNLTSIGANLIMSTDCGIPGVPHEALAGGIDVIHELTGLSAVETLKLATSHSATTLGLNDRGTIEPGKRADLLVVASDPTIDLSALEHVRYVLKAGEVVAARPV
jgi:imidazolonepropionase-like amidohydrolase